jgi:Holliday junction resolvasome RuvABC endonuclease subunit
MRSFDIENMHYAQTMRILGLDLSLTSTGWATNGKTGSIAVKTKESQRLYDIRKEVNRIIVENQATSVVIEGYAFAARNSQSHKIGELGGVIRLTLLELGIPHVDVPPTCRAKFATGRGNAAKTEVISAVSARTGIVWSGKGADDEVDAWLLEEMGWTALGMGHYDWPKASLDALKNVDWSPIIETGTPHGNT